MRAPIDRRQDGFTLIEVLFAGVISIVAMLAIAGTVGKGIFNSLGHQRQAGTLTIAQHELEKVRQIVAQYGFDALSMSGQPGAPTGGALALNPSDPDDFITGYGTSSAAFKVMESFHITTRGVATGTPTAGEPLVFGGTVAYPTSGRIAPLSTVTSGSVSATVYRYVTRRVEACTTVSTCTGDSRRVIIAIVPTNNPTTELQSSKPVYLTTVFDNPVPQNEPGQPGSGLRIGVNIG